MCWTVADDSTDSESAEDDGDGSAQTYVMHFVDIRCYWVGDVRPAPSATRATSRPGREQRAMARSADTDYRGQWVVDRSVKSVRIDASLRSKLADAGAEVLAKSISNKAFPLFTDRWVVRDPGGAAAVSNMTESAQSAMHEFVLGVPATDFSSAIGVPPAASPLVDEVARELPLGIDGLFDTIKRVAQVAGMVIGVATGVPLVHLAACKAFVHDQVTRGLTREFEKALTAPSEPERRTHAPPVTPGQPGRMPAGRTEAGGRDEQAARRRREGQAARRRRDVVRRQQRPSPGDTPHSRG